MTSYPTKPSKVFQAIIDGIRAYKDNPTFHYDMSNWGSYSTMNNVCLGCLATSTIANIKLKGASISRAAYEKCNFHGFSNCNAPDRQIDFEITVNNIRCGDVYSTVRYWFDEYGDYDADQLETIREGLHVFADSIIDLNDTVYGHDKQPNSTEIHTDLIRNHPDAVIEILEAAKHWFIQHKL